jgi:hypothetical protein
MTLVEKLGQLVADTSGRYMNPDPTRPIKIGSYGRVENGVLRRAGELPTWFKTAGINDLNIAPITANITESSRLASSGVREQTVSLMGTATAAPVGNAKIGLELSFSRNDQFYFLVPGLRFTGMDNMETVGNRLVACAKLDHHEKQFWLDEFCVVTGIYTVPSMLRVMAEQASEKVAFTANGAATIDDLYRVGADFSFVSRNDTSTVLCESYRADNGDCVVFYELHKVHWDIFGNKWWKGTTDLNP